MRCHDAFAMKVGKLPIPGKATESLYTFLNKLVQQLWRNLVLPVKQVHTHTPMSQEFYSEVYTQYRCISILTKRYIQEYLQQPCSYCLKQPHVSSIVGWINSYSWYVCIHLYSIVYSGILYGHEKSYCYIVDSHEDNGKQKKPGPKGYMLYDSISMIYENRQN